MASRMEPCIPLDFDAETLEEIVNKGKDWALMHGAAMRPKAANLFSLDSLSFAPFMLLPSSFPRREFEKSLKLQPLINELIHRVANNYEFLKKSLSVTITVDPFTASLFKIFSTVQEEGVAQAIGLGLIRNDVMLGCDAEKPETPLSNFKLRQVEDTVCGLFRCDYMLDSGTIRDTIRQVEINTIASSFAGISQQAVSPLHRFILQELSQGDKLSQLPENRALETLCGGMLKAWTIYNQPHAVILFIVEDVTYNICDQRFHEFEIRRQNPNVRVIRRNLTQLGGKGKGGAKLGPNKQLLIDGHEVAVVYFRSGYSPDQYPSDDGCEWNARLTIERSRAIKCPSISYHLAGTKKVQQILAQPGVIEELLGDKAKATELRNCFTGLYSLDMDEEGDRAVEMALLNPEKFVLKPQREGGGNNVYGKEVGEVLSKMKNSPERAGYILMDVIQPPLLRNYIVRPSNKPMLVDTVSELGIFGVVIGNGNEIYENTMAGHMLRTKLNTANEGGVAAGLGALDSPFLVDY